MMHNRQHGPLRTALPRQWKTLCTFQTEVFPCLEGQKEQLSCMQKSTRWCRKRRCANIKPRRVHRTRGKWKRTSKVGFWPQCWQKEKSKAWIFVTTRAAIDAQLPWRGQQKRLWIYRTIYCRYTHWAGKQSTCWTIPYNTMHCSLWLTLSNGKCCDNSRLKCLPVVCLFVWVCVWWFDSWQHRHVRRPAGKNY